MVVVNSGTDHEGDSDGGDGEQEWGEDSDYKWLLHCAAALHCMDLAMAIRHTISLIQYMYSRISDSSLFEVKSAGCDCCCVSTRTVQGNLSRWNHSVVPVCHLPPESFDSHVARESGRVTVGFGSQASPTYTYSGGWAGETDSWVGQGSLRESRGESMTTYTFDAQTHALIKLMDSGDVQLCTAGFTYWHGLHDSWHTR